MYDIFFIGLSIACGGLCLLYVLGCERL